MMNNDNDTDTDCERAKQTRSIDPAMGYFNNIDRYNCKKRKKLVTIIIAIVAIIIIAILATHIIDFVN